MKIWSIEEEAAALRARFEGVNRAAFAREHQVKGGQAMIYQHITGRRPISIEAAMAYAAGFGCPLSEISPRLAAEAQKAASLSLDTPETAPAESSRWPFQGILEDQVLALPPNQLSALEGAMALAIAQLKLGVNVSAQPKAERLEQARKATLSSVAAANEEHHVAVRKVAVKVRAGVPGFSADQTAEEFDGEIHLPLRWLTHQKLRAEKLIATSVFGDSMEPRITKDDLLLINTADTTQSPGKLFGVNHEGEFIVKRLDRVGGHWYLVSDNPDQVKHPPVRCNEKTFVIGRVVMLQAVNV